MELNRFLPHDISLLSNPELIKMALAYRQAHGYLAGTSSARLKNVRTQIGGALLTIEQELCARSLQIHLHTGSEPEPFQGAASLVQH